MQKAKAPSSPLVQPHQPASRTAPPLKPANPVSPFTNHRLDGILQAKLVAASLHRNTPSVIHSQLNTQLPIQLVPEGEAVVQRLVGAAHPIVGTDIVLPGVAGNRGAAAEKIAKYINLRARETVAAGAGGPAQHANVSALGANNPGNLYVRSDYTNGAGQASRLEGWAEMTGVGGGYIKRVRVTENAVVLMDRVMNEAAPTALNAALQADAGAGGVHLYGSVHTLNAGDTNSLEFRNAADRDADNLTKVMGEGARFVWLAQKLGSRGMGNTSRNVFKVSIKIPQAGTFTMDPTFEQLWGAWASCFDRSYMKNKDAAKTLLKQRLTARFRPPRDGDLQGVAPLASGAAAAGQVTSLLGVDNRIMLMPVTVGGVSGADMVADLRMTWTADH